MANHNHIRLSFALLAAFLFSAVAAAALTVSSPTETSYIGTVPISVTANATQDSISYVVEPGKVTATCEDCSSLSGNLNLTPGTYAFSATALLGNETEEASLNFSVISIPDVTPLDFSLEINDPKNTTLTSQYVYVNLATNATVDSLEYRLDSGFYTEACTDCSTFNTTVLTENGTHTFRTRATIGNLTKQASVAFTVAPAVVVPAKLHLSIESPEAKGYRGGVPVRLETNLAASISYAIDGAHQTLACTNCSRYTTNLNLSLGNHTLVATAVAANQSDTASVHFSVVNRSENKTGKPPYASGFEKLPQAVSSGNISDAELAAIIRANRLNPGIINRLIKTHKLGNESISAIIDTQQTPPGIWRKIMGFFGVHLKTPKDSIAETYNLTEEQDAKLLASDDVTPKTQEHARQNLQAHEKKRIEASNDAKAAPGQEKKASNDASSAGNSKKVGSQNNPGQAKKQQGRNGSEDNANRGKDNNGHDNSGNMNGNAVRVPPGKAKMNK
jgi:hypothetical protein